MLNVVLTFVLLLVFSFSSVASSRPGRFGQFPSTFKNLSKELIINQCQSKFLSSTHSFKSTIDLSEVLQRVKTIATILPQTPNGLRYQFKSTTSIFDVAASLEQKKIKQIAELEHLRELIPKTDFRQKIVTVTINKLKAKKYFHLKDGEEKLSVKEYMDDRDFRNRLQQYITINYGIFGEFLVALRVGEVDYLETSLNVGLPDHMLEAIEGTSAKDFLNLEMDVIHGNRYVEVKFLTENFGTESWWNDKIIRKMQKLAKIKKILSDNGRDVEFDLVVLGPGVFLEETSKIIESLGINVYWQIYLGQATYFGSGLRVPTEEISRSFVQVRKKTGKQMNKARKLRGKKKNKVFKDKKSKVVPYSRHGKNGGKSLFDGDFDDY